MKLTERQIDDMRHALGLTNSKKAYRNHYCADPDNKDVVDSWDDLVSKGLAVRHEPKPYLPYYTYQVTDAGKVEVER